jgi:hypothetical protein
MDRRAKLMAGAIGAIVVIGAGTGVGLASSGNDDAPLTGSAFDKATEAALDHVGEGTVVETERGDDGAAYEVEIQLDDGSQVEVQLDDGFKVTGSENDDDGTGERQEGVEDD